MVIDELGNYYSLFADGLVVGGLLSAIPFSIGYAINALFDLIKRA